MNKSTIILLEILTGLYWFNYMVMFFSFDLASIEWDIEQVTVHLMMFLFSVAFAFSFIRIELAGVLLQLWNFLVWVFALTVWPDAGMVLLLAAPALVLGVFMLYFGLLRYGRISNDLKSRWHFILQSLMLNYFFIALLGTFVGPNRPEDFSLWSMPMLIIPLFTFALIVVFVISWSRKFLTGILLIVWYVMAGVFQSIYPEVPNQEGPILLFGFALLVQGVLYIVFHLKFRPNHKINEAG